jgi:hypothetical protein
MFLALENSTFDFQFPAKLGILENRKPKSSGECFRTTGAGCPFSTGA